VAVEVGCEEVNAVGVQVAVEDFAGRLGGNFPRQPTAVIIARIERLSVARNAEGADPIVVTHESRLLSAGDLPALNRVVRAAGEDVLPRWVDAAAK